MRSIFIFASLLSGAGLATPPPRPVPALPKAPLSIPKAPDEAQAFADAEQALARFEALQLTLSKDADLGKWAQHLQKQLTALTTSLADVQARYARLAATASPSYAIPALVRAGEVQEKFAADLEALPLHPDFDRAAAAQIRKAMVQGAQAVRVAARSSYAQAVLRAEATGFKGEWLDFAKAALVRLPSAIKAR